MGTINLGPCGCCEAAPEECSDCPDTLPSEATATVTGAANGGLSCPTFGNPICEDCGLLNTTYLLDWDGATTACRWFVDTDIRPCDLLVNTCYLTRVAAAAELTGSNLLISVSFTFGVGNGFQLRKTFTPKTLCRGTYVLTYAADLFSAPVSPLCDLSGLEVTVII